MSPQAESGSSEKCQDSCDCNRPVNRREFLTVSGLGVASTLLGENSLPAMAGPFDASDFEKLIPPDKKLDPAWVRSLFDRGEPAIFRGSSLEKIGMPIGGICAGQLYLGGDGKLWHWDIFNQPIATGDSHYAHPLQPASPLDQGFAIKVNNGNQPQIRTLDQSGFANVTFKGQYPIGFVEYSDADAQVAVSLEAFSPFIPLNTDDSSMPAAILQFTVTNISKKFVEAELAGWLENAVCLNSGRAGLGIRRNVIERETEVTFLECRAEPSGPPPGQFRAPIVFADFEGDSYGDWKIEGQAFGKRPSRGAVTVQSLSGFKGQGLVNTWNGSDTLQGKLTSPTFRIERRYISFLIGGGNHPGETCINLIVNGKVVRSETGKNSDTMEWANWDVNDLAGKTAQIQIVDVASGDWGHIDIDQIEFGDLPRFANLPLDQQPDFGTMGLGLLTPTAADWSAASLPIGTTAEQVFHAAPATAKPFGQKLLGAVGRKLELEPGQSARATFVVTWCFPNLTLSGTRLPRNVGRYYAKRFSSATDVARYIAHNFPRLRQQTELWHRTWYDSTLPFWFLDRTFANTSTLATSTCHRFRNGRFYGWEGVGCCAGTCTHVWHYAHAAARIFPELERITRERVDYADGVGFDPRTGIISHRAEEPVGPAIDGQAGTILRTYREHQMSPDREFLKRVWPNVKKSLQYLISRDGNADGIIEGAQHNTLDAEWFGKSPWLSSLYLAALSAGSAMASEMGDNDFAQQSQVILHQGSNKIVAQLWNEPFQYFIQTPDPAHLNVVGSYEGCHVDQVFGQSWTHQVNLDRVLDEKLVKAALRSLWKYNFTPDVGPFRSVHRSGRWYALAGEGGLIMVTFPKTPSRVFKDNPSAWSAMYFNECMNGFEYQVAGHMIWEGMALEGLVITRAVHDRYHPLRRNPWNEVECGDHYARSMASYGIYLAACGFEYHGPKQHLGFHPRMTPENFRAAFTSSQGWGTFHQKREKRRQREIIELQWGRLQVQTLTFTLPSLTKPSAINIVALGKTSPAHHQIAGDRLTVTLPRTLLINAGESLEVQIGFQV